MKMSPEYFWPLVGILLGWTLSVVANGWKSRTERLKLLGCLLSRLLDIQHDVRKLIRASELVKDMAHDWANYELQRQRIISKHFLSSNGRLDDLPTLISNFSGYYPFLAVELQTLTHSILKTKEIKLDTTSANPDTYVRLISVLEVALDHIEDEISKLASSIAFRHGISTYIRFWLHQRKSERKLKTSSTFLREYSDEILSRKSRDTT